MKVAFIVETVGDRNATVAVANAFGERFTASAKREPGDPYSPLIGDFLSVARVLRKIADSLEKDARAEIDHNCVCTDEGCVSE